MGCFRHIKDWPSDNSNSNVETEWESVFTACSVKPNIGFDFEKEDRLYFKGQPGNQAKKQ